MYPSEGSNQPIALPDVLSHQKNMREGRSLTRLTSKREEGGKEGGRDSHGAIQVVCQDASARAQHFERRERMDGWISRDKGKSGLVLGNLRGKPAC